MKIEIDKLTKIFLAIIFLTPILLLGFLVVPVRAEWADHMVISEIQTEGATATDEFIELYNPLNTSINLSGWRLTKKTASGATVANLLTVFPDINIPAFSYFLIAHPTGYDSAITADAVYSTASSLSYDNTIILYSDAGNTIVDMVGMGTATNFEGAGAVNPLTDGSIERKAIIGSTAGSLSDGADKYLGNGWDSDNNSEDFIVRVISDPQNLSSAVEHQAENIEAPSSTPAVSPNLSPEPISDPTMSIPSSQIILPQAEAGSDKEAVVGENIDFDASDSLDPQGKELVYNWDFGDGTNAKGVNVSHGYNIIGEYKVVLKVDNGENISEDSLKVKIVAPEFSDKIILSEILPNPIGADKDGEWIELFNSGDARVNLRGWLIGSSSKTGGKQFIFSGDNFIESKNYLVVKRSDSGLVLTNESGSVRLAQSADKIVSEVSYGASKEGQSHAFINNKWQWTDIPTPGKENSVKVLTTISKEKENIISLANIEENADDEVLGDEGSAKNDTIIKSSAAKNKISQPLKNIDIEDYLNKLIAEKVDSAILKAKANEIGSQEKMVALADNNKGNGIGDENKEAVCRDFCSENEKNALDKTKDVRNNPWFWGDIALSVMSLFLVWRYQEVRKKLKN